MYETPRVGIKEAPRGEVYSKFGESELMKEELVYLVLLVSQGGLNMDKKKVEAILSWSTRRSTTEARSFHVFTQFYRNFVRMFSEICAPMMDMIKGGMKANFLWTKPIDKSFERLKKGVETQPIFVLPNFEKPFVVECDASNIVVEVVLSQEGKPMVFFTKNLNEAKTRY